MGSSAGLLEDSLEGDLSANWPNPRRVAGAPAPAIQKLDPCHSDTRKRRQSDMLPFQHRLQLTPRARRQILSPVSGPNGRSSQ